MTISEEPDHSSAPSLDHSIKKTTRTVPLEMYKTLTQDELKQLLGTAYFSSNALLALHFEASTDPLIFNPALQTFLGRFETSADDGLYIDLVPYEAVEKGVSRFHAALFRSEAMLVIQDLHSTNGTVLNGRLLLPNEQQRLHDGDEIYLGMLRIDIAFQDGEKD
jgi:hypothetical protein